MIKKFLSLVFGDWGILVSSILTSILSAIMFPAFIEQVRNAGLISLLVSILFGIFAVGFYASSSLGAIFLTIRTGIAKHWLLFSLAVLVVIADAIILILNLI